MEREKLDPPQPTAARRHIDPTVPNNARLAVHGETNRKSNPSPAKLSGPLYDIHGLGAASAAPEGSNARVTTELPPEFREAGKNEHVIALVVEQDKVISSLNPLRGSICIRREADWPLASLAVGEERCTAKSGFVGEREPTSTVAAALLEWESPVKTAVK